MKYSLIYTKFKGGENQRHLPLTILFRTKSIRQYVPVRPLPSLKYKKMHMIAIAGRISHSPQHNLPFIGHWAGSEHTPANHTL